jgi:hypothetical protein
MLGVLGILGAMQMPSGLQLKAARILAQLEQAELAKLAKVHITTIVRLEGFGTQPVRGQSGTITAVVNALAKAGVDLGENGSVIPRPRGKSR